ncbi:MAG TPA: relaxase/mobilization nuclease domain-containing protein [Rhizomicrobium sp.]|jgi:hypothetical protein|nr:relaxase/mobilization nuclease domain-containing protein [Rhizomicrobium sp.]
MADYLTMPGGGERGELVELRGFASDNLRDACTDIEIQAECTRAEKPFFHAYVRLPDHESLTREQWLYVADRLETTLGFDEQPRAVAFHHYDDGTTHMHIAWSRIDTENERAIDPGLYKNKMKELCRELEVELDLTRVRSEREEGRKTLAAGRDEFEQARRLGTDLTAIRESIRACVDATKDGQGLREALENEGFLLSRGDRRDFVVIDREGGDHALGKRITGLTAGEMRERLSDLDRSTLPSVEEAKELQKSRLHAITEAKEIIAWDDKVAAAGIAKDKELDDERRAALEGLKKGALADEKILRAAENREFWTDYGARQDAAAGKRIEEGDARRADEIANATPSRLPQLETAASSSLFVAADVIGGVAKALEDFCDGLIGAFEPKPEPREISPGEFASSAAARAEYRQQQEAEREAARARSEALDRLREDIEKGRHLDPESVKNLAPADHVNIKAKGEAHLVQIIEDHEREKERQSQLGGRERER